jgi:hypothetical protein
MPTSKTRATCPTSLSALDERCGDPSFAPSINSLEGQTEKTITKIELPEGTWLLQDKNTGRQEDF